SQTSSSSSGRSTGSALAGPTRALRLHAVSKTHGSGDRAVHALDQIELEAASGELLCLVGASGCGKTTLLNLIAGLDEPTSGQVAVVGRVGLMFQEAALFPWLTTGENVTLALKLNGTPKAER